MPESLFWEMILSKRDAKSAFVAVKSVSSFNGFNARACFVRSGGSKAGPQQFAKHFDFLLPSRDSFPNLDRVRQRRGKR
jgi:hypothetical protein